MRLSTQITRCSRLTNRGLTLVEMLIGMAITLVMMAAVVNLFANIGSGIRVRRASMELGTQLRTARSRLFKDLAGATVAARPKLPSDDHDDGYLEIIEGQYSDKNPSLLLDGIDDGPGAANRELDYAASIVPSGGDPQILIPSSSARIPTPNDVTNGGSLGDYDDILALTVRSESEPFVGRFPIWDTTINDGQGNAGWWRFETIESDLAEVIWFAVENPADGTLGEPGMRTIYRRVLLIAPWVTELPNYSGAVPGKRNATNDKEYFRLCDISFRREGNLRVANTLSDLTKRENRFAHRIINPSTYPHPMQISNIRLAPGTDLSPLHPYGDDFETLEIEETEASDRQGEDVMLNDVLAFDLRVFDPGAPLYAVNGNPLEPSDAGWNAAYVNQEAPAPVPPGLFDSMIGQGAYVDLGYVEAIGLAPIPPNDPPPAIQPTRPQFSGLPEVRSKLNFTATTDPIKFVVYDTWPYHYEDDGINQDGDTYIDQNGTPQQLVDEGTDGLDTDGNNGVDDANERETSPPYDHPLRAMQVKLRVYDRDTRQIREATVTRNFVPQ